MRNSRLLLPSGRSAHARCVMRAQRTETMVAAGAGPVALHVIRAARRLVGRGVRGVIATSARASCRVQW